ncbi:zinc finger matrin-type protein 1 isoform X2 [Cyclopterus lumpus]|uniref:Matrin-type domain-containing protein n=1 Tax=Cyclopterus lumpus TaxID=8103 RepID=A0A8C2ZZV3_CYCLU|nr:zinc finger matrin-type protein 1 isoform X2 [Cyclopterus lumpus]
MADISVCTPLLAESDTLNNTTSTPNAASVTDAGPVINTLIDRTQVEGDQRPPELLEGLLTDDYCHVCEAVLLFESQRLSHYEGKKHAHKLKVFMQARRAEDLDRESMGLQRTMTTNTEHFCALCNMVFSSHVVAKFHYGGKVHAKHLRKQGLQPPVTDERGEARAVTRLVRGPDADLKSAPRGDGEHLPDPTGTAAAPSTEVDLKDPNKHCALCAAYFNNPQMALQHYNGRKHQRNQARRDLLKELGDDVQQANSLMCQMCSLQFNSVEMYQSHMQGNKHQIREKTVVKLCKSQQKDYNTFADELADYIQVQKARGITPKAGQVLPLQREGEEEEKEEEAFNQGDIVELNKRMPNLPPTAHPPHHSRPGGYYPAAGWRPPHQGGPPWPSHPLDYSCPPPAPPSEGSPLFNHPPTDRKRRRKQLSSSSGTSSSHSSSSSSSSFSSSASDSDGSEYRRRGKRRMRRPRREGDRKPRDEDSDKEETRRKRRRRERDDDSGERRREESGESEKESGRKKQKNPGKQRRREDKRREEDGEVGAGDRVMDSSVAEDMMDSRKETEKHIQADMNTEQGEGEGGQGEAARPKYRKEKKKTKERADTRTEDEKLWDDSILGC